MPDLVRLRVECVSPAPEGQARRHFDPARLLTLAESLRRSGVREPVIVRPHESIPGHYRIVAGERRWRAAQLAGLTEIPCLVDETLADPKRRLLAQAEENLHREDLNAVEEATALVQLMEAFGVDAQEAGALIGRSYQQVCRLLQLHTAPQAVRDAIVAGLVDARAGLELVRIYNKLAHRPGPNGRKRAVAQLEELIDRVVNERWTVRRLENYAKRVEDGDASAAERPATATPAPGGSAAAARSIEPDAVQALLAALGPGEASPQGPPGEGRPLARHGPHPARRLQRARVRGPHQSPRGAHHGDAALAAAPCAGRFSTWRTAVTTCEPCHGDCPATRTGLSTTRLTGLRTGLHAQPRATPGSAPPPRRGVRRDERPAIRPTPPPQPLVGGVGQLAGSERRRGGGGAESDFQASHHFPGIRVWSELRSQFQVQTRNTTRGGSRKGRHTTSTAIQITRHRADGRTWRQAMAGRRAAVMEPDNTEAKLMQTFRMPRSLVAKLRAEADRKGIDLTALVIKLTSSYLEDFGLPAAATTFLDQDRAALKMDRHAYLLHLLFQRALAIREQGPGFDVPKAERKGR